MCVYPPTREGRLGMQLKLFRARDLGGLGAWPHLHLRGKQYGRQRSGVYSAGISSPSHRSTAGTVEGRRPRSGPHCSDDHNSAGYRETEEAVDKLEHGLKSINDFPGEPEEKDQFVAVRQRTSAAV
jgi:hypothetical protein